MSHHQPLSTFNGYDDPGQEAAAASLVMSSSRADNMSAVPSLSASVASAQQPPTLSASVASAQQPPTLSASVASAQQPPRLSASVASAQQPPSLSAASSAGSSDQPSPTLSASVNSQQSFQPLIHGVWGDGEKTSEGVDGVDQLGSLPPAPPPPAVAMTKKTSSNSVASAGQRSSSYVSLATNTTNNSQPDSPTREAWSPSHDPSPVPASDAASSPPRAASHQSSTASNKSGPVAKETRFAGSGAASAVEEDDDEVVEEVFEYDPDVDAASTEQDEDGRKLKKRKSSLFDLVRLRQNVSKFFGGDDETIARWQELYYNDDEDGEEEADDGEEPDEEAPDAPTTTVGAVHGRKKSTPKTQEELAPLSTVFKDAFQKARSLRRRLSAPKSPTHDLEMQSVPSAGPVRKQSVDDEWFGGSGMLVPSTDLQKPPQQGSAARAPEQQQQQQQQRYQEAGPPPRQPGQPSSSKPGKEWFGFDASNTVALPAGAQQAQAQRQAQQQRQQQQMQRSGAPPPYTVHNVGQQRSAAAPQDPRQPDPRRAQPAAPRGAAVAGRQPRKPDPTRAKPAASRSAAAGGGRGGPSSGGEARDGRRAAPSAAASRGAAANDNNKYNTRVRKQIRQIREHRPFFTYYMTFCQVVVMVVMLVVYGLAPIKFTTDQESASVDGPDGGTITATRDVYPNFWLGPRPEVLVLMGAKFTPCMRKDERIQDEVLKPQKQEEEDIGCCMDQGSIQGNCYTSTQSECTGFKEWKAGFPCGGEQCCSDFNGNFSVSYPNCEKVDPEATLDKSCRCTVTARPCCVDLVGTCEYQSQDYCDFMQGHYHPDADLCSQVSCLESSCGLVPFVTPTYPDQWYRLYLALFLHVGVIHLVFVLLFQHSIATDIEKLAGWLRMLLIYFISGMGGYLVSAIVTPYQVSTGASPSLYGLLGCLFVELFQAWQLLDAPGREFFKLFVISVIALAVGLLPYVDNWSHVGGFIFGILSAIVFLPYITFGKWDAARKRIMILVCLPGIIGLFVLGFSLMLTNKPQDCEWCTYLNCVDFVENFCAENSQDVL